MTPPHCHVHVIVSACPVTCSPDPKMMLVAGEPLQIDAAISQHFVNIGI